MILEACSPRLGYGTSPNQHNVTRPVFLCGAKKLHEPMSHGSFKESRWHSLYAMMMIREDTISIL